MQTKNDGPTAVGGLALVREAVGGAFALTPFELAIIRNVRSVSPAMKQMVLDMLEDHLSNRPAKAGPALSLVNAAK
jgi:hypothetical protein